MDIKHTSQLIQRLDDAGNLIRISNYSRLTFLTKERFDNMDIIVKHHYITEIASYPISFGHQPHNRIRVSNYLAFGIILSIYLGLALSDTYNRGVNKFLGKNPIMSFMRRNYDFKIAHYHHPPMRPVHREYRLHCSYLSCLFYKSAFSAFPIVLEANYYQPHFRTV